MVYFPVRHHSPACSRHLARLIASWRPEAVLVEGPRDATGLVDMLLDPQLVAPVALYTTYVQGPEQRHSAYYPLCDYSPELVALREGRKVGARLRFIDLTFPEMVVAEGAAPQELRSLLDERYLQHSRVLRLACERAGARDPDDLWDRLYETRAETADTVRFMEDVLAYCALAREDLTPELLEADGTLVRERAMAHEIAAEKGRVLVVTGGFHSLALPELAGRRPPAVKVAPEHALVVLMRYGFEQLDRLNGYASGLPSPEFYQTLWEGLDPAHLLVRLGRELREDRRGAAISTADCQAALLQARNLASFRGHAAMAREDLLDGVRSCFIKGADDVEGAAVLAQTYRLLAGQRLGAVPPGAGQPPLWRDFRETARKLRVEADSLTPQEVALDLYRKGLDRERSRFFHRLRFLEVPFASWVAGPDFVKGTTLELLRERWKHVWSPDCDSRLIVLSVQGSTLAEAAASVLESRFAEAERDGQGRSAALAASLLLEACRMGLHDHTARLAARLGRLLGVDRGFVSLVRTLELLIVLQSAREPLEAHHLEEVPQLAEQAYVRACYELSELAQLPEDDCEPALDALNTLVQSAGWLPDDWARLREAPLELLAQAPGAAPALRGGAAALLCGDGVWSSAQLVTALAGQLHSGSPARAASFLRGLLRCGRSLLWQVDELIGLLHEALRDWREDEFMAALPSLRLGLSDLTPRECHRLAERVAARAGVPLQLSAVSGLTETDLLQGVALNAKLQERLRADGLEDWL